LLQGRVDHFRTLEDELMKRWTLAALAAASLLSATAIANTISQVDSQPATTHTAAHWRAPEASSRDKVREYVPSVNYVIEGQTVGVSVIPSF
jgi:hypothetical protein